jgi:hypothetical protein
MPLRSYLKSAEAGKVLAGKRFAAYVVCRRADGLGSGHTTPDEVSPTSGPRLRTTTPDG